MISIVIMMMGLVVIKKKGMIKIRMVKERKMVMKAIEMAKARGKDKMRNRRGSGKISQMNMKIRATMMEI